MFLVGITAINQPLWALVCACWLTIGRIAYAVGYRKMGPKGRTYGAIIGFVTMMAAFIGSIVSVATWDMSDGEKRLIPMSVG